jgi:hypothetical protein
MTYKLTINASGKAGIYDSAGEALYQARAAARAAKFYSTSSADGQAIYCYTSARLMNSDSTGGRAFATITRIKL